MSTCLMSTCLLSTETVSCVAVMRAPPPVSVGDERRGSGVALLRSGGAALSPLLDVEQVGVTSSGALTNDTKRAS
jgi:hypothetical protein